MRGKRSKDPEVFDSAPGLSGPRGTTFALSSLRPEDLEDRTLLREKDMMSVYIVYGGVRYGFPSDEALYFAGFKLSDVRRGTARIAHHGPSRAA